MKLTIYERAAITGVPLPPGDCWVVTCTISCGPGPSETRVESAHRSKELARRARRRSGGGDIRHLSHRARRGDIIAIHDGRNIAAELGLY